MRVSSVPFGYRFCVAVGRLTSLLTPVPFPSLFRRDKLEWAMGGRWVI